MAITNYHTVSGEIIGETTSSVRTGYLTDGLGSVTATQASTGSVSNTYRYKPYGALLAKTGVSPDPSFLWVGSWGYQHTTGGLSYMRARHYHRMSAVWTSQDSLWPKEPAYVYCFGAPIDATDASGRSCCCCPEKISATEVVSRQRPCDDAL